MLFKLGSLLACVAVASAHFQMQFPDPRGPFVEKNEVNFCDSYTDAVSNRSSFPLGQGFISINSEHPQWTAAVLISVEQDPTNFSVFNTSTSGIQLPFAVPFFQASGEGAACIPIDIQNLNISGVKDGSNVTIQVQFDGGDGNLFQCSDLTLSSSFQIPSSDNCTNVVVGSFNGSTATGTGTGTSAQPSNTNSASTLGLPTAASVLAALIAFFLNLA